MHLNREFEGLVSPSTMGVLGGERACSECAPPNSDLKLFGVNMFSHLTVSVPFRREPGRRVLRRTRRFSIIPLSIGIMLGDTGGVKCWE